MKLKNKRMIAGLIFAFSLVCSSFSTQALAQSDPELSDYDKGMQVLLDSGWTRADVEDLIPDNAVEDYAGVKNCVISEPKYFKVSKNGVVSEITKSKCMKEVYDIKKMESNNATKLRAGIPIGDATGDDVTTTDGYLTYYAHAGNIDGTYYYLSARFEWLIPPVNNKIDVFGLGHCTNLDQCGDYSDIEYAYKSDIYFISSGHSYLANTYTTDTPTTIKLDCGGTAITQDLSDGVPAGGMGYTYRAKNERGWMRYKAKVNNPNVDSVSIYSEYLHQQTIIKITPTVTYPGGGSLSATPVKKFKRMSPNPYFQFDV